MTVTRTRRRATAGIATLTVGAAAAAALVLTPASASAYSPGGGVLYQLPDDQPCLKGRGNCAVYPKSAQLPDGRLVAAFERSTVAASGSAVGQTMPIYASDDFGSSWYPLSEVAPPAELSAEPELARYTSNWTNPYLYVLPSKVGSLHAGTLLLASVVSGEDEYYVEHKAADPSWVPSNDGDRRDMAIALFASTDDGATWKVVNVIATGGWQGGSAGATGVNVAGANTYAQVDPLWEPYLMVHDGELVAYYSDENDYLGYDHTTGEPIIDPANATAPDDHGQVLVHRTWDGRPGHPWSTPVVDAAGETVTANGEQHIGGGRPGMTNVVPTTDGKWMITYEYWGSETWGWPAEANVRYEFSDSPLDFFSDGDDNGEEISRYNEDQADGLPFPPGTQGLSWGGSPVTIALPDGRLVYNASGNGDVWVNETGRSDGLWTQFNTAIGSGYSRNLQYVEGTGRVVILQGTWGGPTASAIIRYGEVDLGHSDGQYYRIVNRASGQVLGTGGNITDAEFDPTGKWVPDIQLEDEGAYRADTQRWHRVDEADGTLTLLNESGGREVAVWGPADQAVPGTPIAQWVDETDGGRWFPITTSDGYLRLQAVGAPTELYLTAAADTDATLEPALDDGTQEWAIVPVGPEVTVKHGSRYTVGSESAYRKVSFAIDAAGVDLTSVTVNGVEVAHRLDGPTLDLNVVTPGRFGAVRGPNVLEATDANGDTRVVEFTLG